MDVIQIPNILSNTSLYSTLLLTMMMQKFTPETKSCFLNEYDYIIVGAGSAGSALAGRLSEDDRSNVLLLEAGPSPPSMTEVSALSAAIYASKAIDWDMYTTPQPHADNKAKIFPRSKNIGGCSVHNFMINVRGTYRDYDNWAKNGCTGWSYSEVLPYFIKMEDFRVPDQYNPVYHGLNGPVTIEKPVANSPLTDYIYEAATKKGFKFGDPNGESQYGFSWPTGTMRDGRRCSASKSYLVPADQNPNLHIVENALVHKVIIKDKRATGVLVEFGGSISEVFATKEVIMSAGAIHTPQILMLSGIGPKAHLDSLNIPVIVDLPVGQNFQEHPQVRQLYSFSPEIQSFIKRAQTESNIQQYIDYGIGPLSSPGATIAHAFLTKEKPLGDPSLAWPDKEILFLEESTTGVNDGSQARLMCVSDTLYPKSVGSVTLRTANINDSPVIDPNFFSHPDDIQTSVDGLKFCNDFLLSEPFQRIGVQRSTDNDEGCDSFGNVFDDEFIACTARNAVFSIFHPIGTAKMGRSSDNSTVVDPTLKVKGIDGLRVVDASIIPTHIGGHTGIPVIMIAEKAADMIRGIKNV